MIMSDTSKLLDSNILDIIAVIWFFTCWLCYSLFAEYRRKSGDNLLKVMNDYRHQWMKQMLKRSNRMADETAIGNLLRSISFFASTSILILAGLFSILGSQKEITQLLSTMPFAVTTSPTMFDIKIMILAMIFIYSFFKFTWSLRQYNYAAIYVASAPLHNENLDMHEEYAERGGKLVANAAKHFNLGLRAYYYAMAALSWFVHPVMMMLCSVWVVLVLYRREFRSRALEYMISSRFI